MSACCAVSDRTPEPPPADPVVDNAHEGAHKNGHPAAKHAEPNQPPVHPAASTSLLSSDTADSHQPKLETGLAVAPPVALPASSPAESHQPTVETQHSVAAAAASTPLASSGQSRRPPLASSDTLRRLSDATRAQLDDALEKLKQAIQHDLPNGESISSFQPPCSVQFFTELCAREHADDPHATDLCIDSVEATLVSSHSLDLHLTPAHIYPDIEYQCCMLPLLDYIAEIFGGCQNGHSVGEEELLDIRCVAARAQGPLHCVCVSLLRFPRRVRLFDYQANREKREKRGERGSSLSGGRDAR